MPFFDGIEETELPKSSVVQTDVVIVGSGPAGASAALFLSTLGVRNIMLTKYRWTANTPRAHIVNQRTMEILRDVGVEDEVLADSAPPELMGDTVLCTSVAGEELGRILAWGTHPARQSDYRAASPSRHADVPQTLFEPVLVRNATVRGTHSRFSSEYVSHRQNADGVIVHVLDRLDGREYEIRCKYLIAADGARSQIATDAKLPFAGDLGVSGSMVIPFQADLEELLGATPSVLYWVVQPDPTLGGAGPALVRMVRCWDSWLLVWGYDASRPAPELTEESAAHIVRSVLGLPEAPLRIRGFTRWAEDEMYATQLSKGRVFLTGDAAHRHPQSNGLGSNTAVQDSYNLAWKMAAVLHGYADPDLLDTYSYERAPVARQVVERANASLRQSKAVIDALGHSSNDGSINDASINDGSRDATDDGASVDVVADLGAGTPQGARRREAFAEALAAKDFEYNAHGVELGQDYAGSSAIVGDGTVVPRPARDPELYYEPHTVPGVRLPHAWLGTAGGRVSTHDLAPYTRFTLFTGPTGEAWADAARQVAQDLDVPLEAVVIGSPQVRDLYFDWARLREVREDGCVLVRPDTHVAWRSSGMVDDPLERLREAMTRILHRDES